ncbi:Protein kinase [Entamoeba marina]
MDKTLPTFLPILIDNTSTQHLHKPDTMAITKHVSARIRETYWHIKSDENSFYTNSPVVYYTHQTSKKTNSSLDNEHHDLLVKKRYYSANPETVSRYQIIENLGNGMFGQVFKAKDLSKEREVAIKILKSKSAYFRQGMLETTVLSMLNDVSNLYQLLLDRNYKGFPISVVRKFMTQLLQCLEVLQEARIVHCDIKPENIIFDQTTNGVKVIDFGSACFDNYTLYTYVQSRHYRAPEIILGIPYNGAIDVWSAGCIAAELVLGIPLFPGSSEYNQLFKITDMLGDIPKYLLEEGTKSACYYNLLGDSVDSRYIMKLPFEYEMENGTRLEPNKSISEARKDEITSATETRLTFIHFVEGLLRYDPMKRWTPSQALHHPFLTGSSFNGEWRPPMNALQQRPADDEPPEMSGSEFCKRYFGLENGLKSLNTAEYYDICSSALQMGEVVNITCANPFQLGPMTPTAFKKAFEQRYRKDATSPRITKRRSSIKRSNENLYRMIQKPYTHTPRTNPPRMTNTPRMTNNPRMTTQSPMKIVQQIDEDSNFFDPPIATTSRRRFDSCNSTSKNVQVQDVHALRSARFTFNKQNAGSAGLDATNLSKYNTSAIVAEPSNVNIPIVPVPLKSDSSQDMFEFAPLFIFGGNDLCN